MASLGERDDSQRSGNGPWGNLDHLYGSLRNVNSARPLELEADAVGSDDETEARFNTRNDGDRGDGGDGDRSHRGGSNKSLGGRDGSPRGKKSIMGAFGTLGRGSSRESMGGFSAVPGADRAEPDDDMYGFESTAPSKGRGGGGKPFSSNPLKSVSFAQARPTIRAILLTAALLLSSSATLGCRFMTVDIGFVPTNLRFNSTVIDLGIWSFPPDAMGSGGGGDRCLAYPAGFSEAFISGDSNWNLARGAGIVGIVVGWIALMISWLLVINSLKPTLRYKIALAFIAAFLLIFESLKFIFLQISLCNAEVWERSYETGAVELKFVRSCKLSTNGNMAVAATMLYLVLVVMLCRSRMREEMEATVRGAGKRATRMRRYSFDHRRSSYGNDANDDDELESLEIDEEEKEAYKALDEALAALETKRFDYDGEDDDTEGETEGAGGTERRGHDSGTVGGLQEGVQEGGSDDDGMEEISIHDDEAPKAKDASSNRSRSDSNASDAEWSY